MAQFSDILITCDFDRSLTAFDTTIPARNLEAIRYFMENGGAFTINTGRGLPMFRHYMDQVPVNAPLLLYNGSAAYDSEKGEFAFCHEIPLDLEDTVRTLLEIAPDKIVELQGADCHYILSEEDTVSEFFNAIGCKCVKGHLGDDFGPFIKLCVYDRITEPAVGGLFQATPEQRVRFDEIEREITARYSKEMSILRAAARIIDLQAAGVSKGRSALELKRRLGRKILICIGDEMNDLTMLDAADYAYCPADAAVADRYENVCACGEGAVADVIYKKIPEILGKMA